MNESLDFLEIEGKIVEALKTVYDPEIPVNVYDLGLIYEIDYTEEKEAKIEKIYQDINRMAKADYEFVKKHVLRAEENLSEGYGAKAMEAIHGFVRRLSDGK